MRSHLVTFESRAWMHFYLNCAHGASTFFFLPQLYWHIRLYVYIYMYVCMYIHTYNDIESFIGEVNESVLVFDHPHVDIYNKR